jgi:hypothetical protein
VEDGTMQRRNGNPNACPSLFSIVENWKRPGIVLFD